MFILERNVAFRVYSFDAEDTSCNSQPRRPSLRSQSQGCPHTRKTVADGSRLLQNLASSVFYELLVYGNMSICNILGYFFLHSSSVTVASRVSAADKCQSGELPCDRIVHCYDFIFSVFHLEWAKSYRGILCQTNY